jgi:hypothetical protein
MAFPDDLDAGGPLRSREHLEILFEATTPGIMWDQYGVVGDVLVGIPCHPFSTLMSHCSSHSHISFHAETFMSYWPPIFYINLSKGCSKIILSHGWSGILR